MDVISKIQKSVFVGNCCVPEGYEFYMTVTCNEAAAWKKFFLWIPAGFQFFPALDIKRLGIAGKIFEFCIYD